MKRTEYCGLLNESHVGQDTTVCGWVLSKRDMGGIIFLDIKDREGVIQVVFDADNPNAFSIAEQIKLQSVVCINGLLRIRGEETYNPRLQTGTIEIKAENISVLSQAGMLPFPIDDNTQINEELRLKYRYLDIRRSSMSDNLRFRHKVVKSVRDYLDMQGFVDVETPILTKSTPEGARDYLVPSRIHKGMFYALPQSPQIFKQLLMVGGMDRYYQVARCFRDEDLRADRQPEFTQVDMEMSFVDQEDILLHLESMFKQVLIESAEIELSEPFIRMTYQKAMDTYGSDKPDLRFGLEIVDITDVARRTDFSIFKQTEAVRLINYKGGAKMSRAEIDGLTNAAVQFGAKGMAWISINEDSSVQSILTKYMGEDVLQEIFTAAKAQAGDFLLFCADNISTVQKVLGGLRLFIADKEGLKDKSKFVFAFITDFPLFEYSEAEDRYVAAHHPFTMPNPEDIEYMLTDKKRVRALSYDLVLNGTELGSGSIRIHDSNMQKLMFEALGFTADEIREKFGFFVDAFNYGTPPHGGFAFGLDRFVMILKGASSLRDIIAFPKTKDGSCSMTDTPSYVEQSQLEILCLNAYADGQKQEEKQTAQRELGIEALADFIHIYLDEQQKKSMETLLNNKLNDLEAVQTVDVHDIQADVYASDIINVLREDIHKDFECDSSILQNANHKKDGFFVVPKVVG